MKRHRKGWKNRPSRPWHSVCLVREVPRLYPAVSQGSGHDRQLGGWKDGTCGSSPTCSHCLRSRNGERHCAFRGAAEHDPARTRHSESGSGRAARSGRCPESSTLGLTPPPRARCRTPALASPRSTRARRTPSRVQPLQAGTRRLGPYEVLSRISEKVSTSIRSLTEESTRE